jgi:WD40 repeat protein
MMEGLLKARRTIMKKSLLLAVIFIAGMALHGQQVAFRSVEKDLILEGIAWDATSGDFFVSSIFKNKIVKIAKNNEWTDFIPSRGDGFAGGVGLHADSERRMLWACSGNVMGDRFMTGVFAYDLKTGKLVKKIFYPESSARRFFNDLAIDRQGAIYITDTYDHSIWKWNLSMAEPVKLELRGEIEYPNGIAISPDDQFLFVTSKQGLKRVTLRGLSVELMPMPQGPFTSIGLDGIAFYKGSILAVQNGTEKARILRYRLSKALDRIERIELLDMENEYFDIPTTLTIADGCLYVVANSQLLNLDQKKCEIIHPEKSSHSLILKYRLE